MTTPVETALAAGVLIPDDIPDEWNWRAAIPSWAFSRLLIAGFPGWNVGREPPCVALHCSGSRRSREIASATDDVVTGLFYYRDWTETGLPFVEDKEVYRSGFWFQHRADAERFHREYGGELMTGRRRARGAHQTIVSRGVEP